MAFTSIAALVGGAAATTTLVLGAIAEVGLAMTVVGGVTGSKTLMKIGGALSLVGGVGGLINSAVSGTASGASMAASGVETMESAAGMADAAYGGTAAMEASQLAGIESMTEGLQAAASNFQSPDWAGMMGEASQSAGAIEPMSNIAEATTNNNALIGMDNAPAPTADVYGNLNPEMPTAAARESLTPKVQDLISDSGSNSLNGADVMDDTFRGAGAGGFGGTGAVDNKSWFSKIMGWAKQNEKLATGMLTLASGGLSGMGQMKQAEMAQEANRMKYQYGNQVASYGKPRPLIGAV
jgi:hypothetical protein